MLYISDLGAAGRAQSLVDDLMPLSNLRLRHGAVVLDGTGGNRSSGVRQAHR
jgi:hypothetical protein